MRRLSLAIKRTSPRQLLKYLKSLSRSAHQSVRRANQCSIREATKLSGDPLFLELVFALSLLISCSIALVVRP